MSEWNAMTYEGKDTLLRVVRQEAEGLFAMAREPGAWEAPTACPGWQVRDVVGHLVDVTEGYFASFDAARSGAPGPDPLGLTIMGERLDERAKAYRSSGQQEMLDRLRAGFDKMSEISHGLGPDDWGGLTVPHSYMGPLPAFFYPTFQLMDYAVHSWDIRQGSGRAHGLSGEAADLLVPFMFVLWQATAAVDDGGEPFALGVQIHGRTGGTFRVSVGPDGFAHEPADLGELPATIEFDPGSFVLTAFGRSNSGTVRGDTRVADRFLNLFFRV